MRKRILTCILAGVLIFTSAVEGISATEVSVPEAEYAETEDNVEDTEAIEVESTQTEEIDALGIEDIGLKTGLLYNLDWELDLEDLPEIYEEPADAVRIKGSAAYGSSWDSYSTNYYYNLMNANQRALWDKLDQMCLGYLSGTETLKNVQHYSEPRRGLDFNFYMTKAVVYTGLSERQALDTIMIFEFSNPQYYFLQSLFDAVQADNGGYAVLTIYGNFGNGATRAAETKKLKQKIDSWMLQVNAQPNDFLKEKMIHDLICENATYDSGYGTVRQNEYNQSVYSTFMHGKTVCAGYAQAMELLCNAAGIDCAVVTSEEHEWNIVRLNGIWYYVDCTWDDNVAEEMGAKTSYPYFNKSKNAYKADTDHAVMHTEEALWNGYLPALVYDSGATVEECGTIATPTVKLTAPSIVSSGSKVTITAPAGAAIYYTTNGTNPSIASTRATRYRGAISLTGTTTVRAIAVANGCYDSAVSSVTVTPKYTITFQANGGYINNKSTKKTTKTLLYGQKLGTLSTPKRKGYAFLGWYTKKSGGSEATANTKAKTDQTYYARWAKIQPKQASISSLKSSGSASMNIKIKKINTASGYQVRYSTNSNMSSSKVKDLSGNSEKIKKLKKGKKYYVQVRMYQKDSVSGKKYYGTWSKVKSVTIKK